MASLEECEAALEAFHRSIAELPGVQGVGITGSGDRHALVIYVTGEQPADTNYPLTYTNEAGPATVEVPVIVKTVGVIRPH